MKKLAEDLETLFRCPFDIDISAKQAYNFQKSTHCHICEQPFEPEDKKVRDHFHLLPYNNNYRGPSHEGCNINYQNSQVVPVVFHNLSGRIDLLPITKEKYISFTKHIEDYPIHFRFIDSFRFMNSRLSTLASYLENFPNLRSQFAKLSEDHYKLLTKKGIMPYDYFDPFERFNETCLPPIDAFYNILENKPCSRRKYLRAQDI
ncbi:unnamed protein product [Psylliodes chrysocephalus]|uniref:DNA-directed DNA polymerase n=1 Tax=Psylliodes chrysocephalus TaxID=3402493 RepID=A0A9P0CZ86_9CUCU|nr:unnamed protein product [Psylliodes chrysocephala]